MNRNVPVVSVRFAPVVDPPRLLGRRWLLGHAHPWALPTVAADLGFRDCRNRAGELGVGTRPD